MLRLLSLLPAPRQLAGMGARGQQIIIYGYKPVRSLKSLQISGCSKTSQVWTRRLKTFEAVGSLEFKDALETSQVFSSNFRIFQFLTGLDVLI